MGAHRRRNSLAGRQVSVPAHTGRAYGRSWKVSIAAPGRPQCAGLGFTKSLAGGGRQRWNQSRNCALPVAAHLCHNHAAGGNQPARLDEIIGHRSAGVTLRYVEITLEDVKREFAHARLSPRHLIPVPQQSTPADQDDADVPAIIRHLSAAIRGLVLYRQQNADAHHKLLLNLSRRLVRSRSRFKKIVADSK